jgi:cytochrome b561
MLYLALLATGLFGWLGYRPPAFRPPPLLFGVATLPSVTWLDPLTKAWMLSAHRWSAWLLIAMIAAHISAVAFHAIVLRDGTLRSMAYWGK